MAHHKVKKGLKYYAREAVNKLGGTYIDTLVYPYHQKGILPDWINQLAIDHGTMPVTVFNEVVHYRNSWAYQMHIVSQNQAKRRQSA